MVWDSRSTFVLVGASLAFRARLFLHARKISGSDTFPYAAPFVCLCRRQAPGDGDSGAPETERSLCSRPARLRLSRLLAERRRHVSFRQYLSTNSSTPIGN